MKKISVINVVNDREFAATFETQSEADSWIAKQSTKESWGKNEIIELKDEQSHENPRAVFVEEISRQEPEFDDQFQPVLIDVEIPSLDENGDPLEDIDGNPVTETVQEQSMIEVVNYKYRTPQEYVVTVEDFVDTAPVKSQIESILDATDWLFVSDVIIPTSYRQAYIEYRAILRTLHNRITDGIATEAESQVESFENFMHRTRSSEFLDGGNGLEIISKFNAKL